MSSTSLDADAREALSLLLRQPRWELLPLTSSLEKAAMLPAGSVVTVTASPGKPIEATCDLARELTGRGFRAVPHLAARMIRDATHLRGLVSGLRQDGVAEAFVVGGDADDPGAFPDALALLRELAGLDHGFERIGVGAYPQGHPLIPTDRLDAALAEKAEVASYMTTQICFDARALGTWLRQRRSAGLTLPLHIGVPGALQAHRLLEVSARIGVADAQRYVRRHAPLVGRVLLPGGYRPDRLLLDLAPLMAEADANVQQLHIFTFNQVAETKDWLTGFAATVARGRS